MKYNKYLIAMKENVEVLLNAKRLCNANDSYKDLRKLLTGMFFNKLLLDKLFLYYFFIIVRYKIWRYKNKQRNKNAYIIKSISISFKHRNDSN